MEKKKIVLLLASLLSFTSCGGGSSNKDKVEHHKESYYEHIDDNYDFYSRDKLTITMMLPEEAGYSDALMSKVEEATNTKINIKSYKSDAYLLPSTPSSSSFTRYT